MIEVDRLERLAEVKGKNPRLTCLHSLLNVLRRKKVPGFMLHKRASIACVRSPKAKLREFFPLRPWPAS